MEEEWRREAASCRCPLCAYICHCRQGLHKNVQRGMCAAERWIYVFASSSPLTTETVCHLNSSCLDLYDDDTTTAAAAVDVPALSLPFGLPSFLMFCTVCIVLTCSHSDTDTGVHCILHPIHSITATSSTWFHQKVLLFGEWRSQSLWRHNCNIIITAAAAVVRIISPCRPRSHY